MSMAANKNFRRNTPQKVVFVVEGVQGSIKPHTILSFQQEQQNFIPLDEVSYMDVIQIV